MLLTARRYSQPDRCEMSSPITIEHESQSEHLQASHRDRGGSTDKVRQLAGQELGIAPLEDVVVLAASMLLRLGSISHKSLAFG